MKSAQISLVSLSLSLFLTGCNSGSSCSSQSNSATNCSTTTNAVTINLHPNITTTVTLGSTLQITADVSGTSNFALTWEVNGTKGGSSAVGTITQDGLYTPPSTVPNPNTVTVTAISQANTDYEANLGIVLISGASITVSPTNVDLIVGKTQQFSARVSGNSNTAVSWQVAGIAGGNSTVGTINSSGLYTAPASLTNAPFSLAVTATAAVDATKAAQASVTLHNDLSVTLSPSATVVETFGQQQFAVSVPGVTGAAFSWRVNGITGGNSTYGTITDSVNPSGAHIGNYIAPNHVPTVSAGSGTNLASGGSKTAPVSVTAIYQGDSYFSASGTISVTSANQKQQNLPTPLGVSGGNGNDAGSGVCCGGTLGALVSRGGQQFILSNSHVLAKTDLGAIGDAIIQPGLFDNSCSTSGVNQVATLSQFVNLESSNFSAPVDAALALVESGKVDSAGTILQLGDSIASDGQPTDGPPHAGSGVAPSLSAPDGVTPLKVAKSGRSTGLTCSTVSAINFTASVTYEKGCGTGDTFQRTYDDLVVISGSDFSAEGDSGALIVTQDTADPLALLFASSDSDSLGVPVGDVLAALADPGTGEKPIFVGTSSTHALAGCSLTGARLASSSSAKALVTHAAPSLDSATLAEEANASSLLNRVGVLGVGVGASLDDRSQGAVIVFLAEGTSTSGLPQQIEGVRVRYVEEKNSTLRHATFSAAETQTMLDSITSSRKVIGSSELTRVRQVHSAKVQELMHLSGIQGVGITASQDAPGEAALLIYTTTGVQHDSIPNLINGARTMVRVASPFRAGSKRRGLLSTCGSTKPATH